MRKKLSQKEYKKEIKLLKKHRARYTAILASQMNLYQQNRFVRQKIEINALTDIALILELVDLEYLDKDAYYLKKDPLHNIEALYYNGLYPLTAKGENLYWQ